MYTDRERERQRERDKRHIERYIYIYIFIERERYREREMQIDREIGCHHGALGVQDLHRDHARAEEGHKDFISYNNIALIIM